MITTFEELKKECLKENKTIWEITQTEEALDSEQTVEAIRTAVLEHVKVMRESIKTGLTSTEKSISSIRLLPGCFTANVSR